MPASVICVLGMHRSGTSATTGMLQLLGVELGEHLMAGDPDVNALGYFEHLKIQELNDQLLESFNSSWDSVLPVDCSHEVDRASEIRRQLGEVLRNDFGNAEMWGVKDPRICRLLPIWKDLFAGTGATPYYLHVLRHPFEVAASLARRDDFSIEKSCCLWLDHVLGAERETRGMTRTFVTYDALVSDPVAVADAIGHDLGIAWPRSVDSVAGTLRAFVSTDLRHHSDPAGQPDGSWALLAVQLYDAIAGTGAEAPPHQTWDHIGRAVDERRSRFDPALVEHLQKETARRILLLRRNLGIRNSLSWKLLAPIRTLQKLFGGNDV